MPMPRAHPLPIKSVCASGTQNRNPGIPTCSQLCEQVARESGVGGNNGQLGSGGRGNAPQSPFGFVVLRPRRPSARGAPRTPRGRTPEPGARAGGRGPGAPRPPRAPRPPARAGMRRGAQARGPGRPPVTSARLPGSSPPAPAPHFCAGRAGPGGGGASAACALASDRASLNESSSRWRRPRREEVRAGERRASLPRDPGGRPGPPPRAAAPPGPRPPAPARLLPAAPPRRAAPSAAPGSGARGRGAAFGRRRSPGRAGGVAPLWWCERGVARSGWLCNWEAGRARWCKCDPSKVSEARKIGAAV